MPRHAQPRRPRFGVSRRARLVAASGLMVGTAIAAVTTTGVAATWSDRAFGESSFAAGIFGFESSVDGGATWATHPEGAPAELALGTGGSGMLPGTSAFGAVSLRSIAASPAVSMTIDGTTPTASGLGAVLQYTVVRSPTCSSSSFDAGATFVVGASTAGVALSADSSTGALTLPAGAPENPGAEVPLCFRLTLPDTAAVWSTPGISSQSLTATWTFLGTE